MLLAVVKHGIAHRFARAHDGFELELELLAHGALRLAGVSLHHGLERGGKQKRVGDGKFLHQRQRRLRAEAARPGHDGAAKVQGGQQRVHQPAGPGPVGRAPEDGVAGGVISRRRHGAMKAVKPKPVLAAHKAGQVANERTVGNECPLGVAGGAAGVNQHGGFFGQRGHRGEVRRLLRQRHRVVHVGQAGGGVQRTHAQHTFQQGAVVAHGLQASQRSGIGQRHHGLAVVQAKGQRLGAKQHRQRHGHRAHLHHRHVGHGGLKALRHDDGHPVAPPHAEHREHVGQPVGVGLQFSIGMNSGLSPRAVGVDRCIF